MPIIDGAGGVMVLSVDSAGDLGTMIFHDDSVSNIATTEVFGQPRFPSQHAPILVQNSTQAMAFYGYGAGDGTPSWLCLTHLSRQSRLVTSLWLRLGG